MLVSIDTRTNTLNLINDPDLVLEHFYTNISGHFDFQSPYNNMVNTFGDGSHFVEVGSWYGKSTAYMAVAIANSKKNIKFDAVDTWRGSPEHQKGGEYEDENAINDTLFNVFQENMKPAAGYYNPVKMDSIEASKQYEDESLDFVFIDASHEYEFVKADILTWLPKVKKGGWIGGHDFTPNDPPTNGVDTAVKEIFGDDYEVDHVSWLHHKA
jgi:hypothetical protein